MSVSKHLQLLLAGTALVWSAAAADAYAATAADQTAPAAGSASELQEVVVTARRTAERLQNVPVAVTAVSQAAINTRGVFDPQNLSQMAPGLTVAPSGGAEASRSELFYSIRGQSYEEFTLFPAVINYFNEVPVKHVQTGMYYDLDQIQILRGPQGVLFGRVTDGGNIMIGPKLPTRQFDASVGVKLGNYNLNMYDGMINLPLVSDKVLLRVAAQVGRRDGYTKNLYDGKDLDNLAYESYRVGLTLRPVDGVENTIVLQYHHEHDNGTGVVFTSMNSPAVFGSVASTFPLAQSALSLNSNGDIIPFTPGATPLTAANYVAALQAELAGQQVRGPRKVFLTGPNFNKQETFYATNTTTININDNTTFKNILGYYRIRDDSAGDYGTTNGLLILTCHSACPFDPSGLPYDAQEQLSDEVHFDGKALHNRLHWSAGGYFDYQHPQEQFGNDGVNVGIIERDQYSYATTRSRAAYGYLEYDASDFVPGLRFNGGVRYTYDSVKNAATTYLRLINIPGVEQALAASLEAGGMTPAVAAQVAAASSQPVPHGLCQFYGVGGIFANTGCVHNNAVFHALTYQVGASYNFTPNKMAYVKYSTGYRPGGVNQLGASALTPGYSPTYAPEHDASVEIGLKADWRFDEVLLRTNIAAYHDDFTSIQKLVELPGTVPLSAIQNVAAATIQGVEFEGTLIPVRGLTLGLNWAYTDASYDKHVVFDPSSCNPAATAVFGFCPFNMFAYTPRNQVSVSLHYTLPLDAEYGRFTIGGDYSWQSKVALDAQSKLHPDVVEPGYGVLNFDATWNAPNRPLDVSLFVTNALNRLYRVAALTLTQSSSVGEGGSMYGPPLMFGGGVTYHFGASANR
ncbi:MAG: TonB-dependent receptor [Caulobacteraceae bacterium]|nr:TonB-dependent receptor [Caulobacteraceae bacterium]